MDEPPTIKNKRHGMSRTPIHNLWWGMIMRCEHESCTSYRDYGGRGIYVCDRWKTFENFYADMGERPDGLTLDRIDNDGPYSPENCRWTSWSEQARNQRRRVEYTAFGKSLLVVEWAELTGIPYNTLHARINKLGWPVEKALSQPVALRPSRSRDRKAAKRESMS